MLLYVAIVFFFNNLLLKVDNFIMKLMKLAPILYELKIIAKNMRYLTLGFKTKLTEQKFNYTNLENLPAPSL